jgi:hypothetical protein
MELIYVAHDSMLRILPVQGFPYVEKYCEQFEVTPSNKSIGFLTTCGTCLLQIGEYFLVLSWSY